MLRMFSRLCIPDIQPTAIEPNLAIQAKYITRTIGIKVTHNCISEKICLESYAKIIVKTSNIY